jgi:hypothetical protein
MYKYLSALVMVLVVSGCSSTQKTEGQGMVSVVAQNVVRIAGSEAVKDLDLSETKERPTHIEVMGFADEFSEGYVLNLIRNAVEDQGGKLVAEQYAKLMVEVAVNAAGNDVGTSGYILGSSARSEGTVDLTITVRDLETGNRYSRQKIVGHAKYQQGSFLGISGSGAYFVLRGDDWEIVDDPTYYE